MLKITLIKNENCAHCADVEETLNELKKEYPDLKIEHIDMLSDEGIEIVQKYQVLVSPGILINGEFFTSGTVTEEQFRKKFEQLKIK